MAIIVKLDVLLAARKVKQGKIKGFRFSTLDALCKYLDCQPGDLFSYIPVKEDE